MTSYSVMVSLPVAIPRRLSSTRDRVVVGAATVMSGRGVDLVGVRAELNVASNFFWALAERVV